MLLYVKLCKMQELYDIFTKHEILIWNKQHNLANYILPKAFSRFYRKPYMPKKTPTNSISFEEWRSHLPQKSC